MMIAILWTFKKLYEWFFLSRDAHTTRTWTGGRRCIVIMKVTAKPVVARPHWSLSRDSGFIASRIMCREMLRLREQITFSPRSRMQHCAYGLDIRFKFRSITEVDGLLKKLYASTTTSERTIKQNTRTKSERKASTMNNAPNILWHTCSLQSGHTFTATKCKLWFIIQRRYGAKSILLKWDAIQNVKKNKIVYISRTYRPILDVYNKFR